MQPVTVIKAGPCVVVQTKTAQADGYEAVQIGLVEEKPAKVSRSQGHYKKANVPPTRVRREVSSRVAARHQGRQPGARLDVRGRRVVDVIGTSRGMGFQGVMKRHDFAGGAATHGRCSTGRPARLAPRRTRRASSRACAAGHMGADRVTQGTCGMVKGGRRK